MHSDLGLLRPGQGPLILICKFPAFSASVRAKPAVRAAHLNSSFIPADVGNRPPFSRQGSTATIAQSLVELSPAAEPSPDDCVLCGQTLGHSFAIIPRRAIFPSTALSSSSRSRGLISTTPVQILQFQHFASTWWHVEPEPLTTRLLFYLLSSDTLQCRIDKST